MKKILRLFSPWAVALSLAACGDSNTPRAACRFSSGKSPPTSPATS